MPGGDRTGPMGQGPMTGRGMGYCTGNAQPGYMTAAGRPLGWGFGRGGGRGLGRGGGRGFRNRYWATGMTAWQQQQAAGVSPGYEGPVQDAVQDEVAQLRAQVQSLQQSLDALNERLKRSES